jgi:hypothetical protein
MIVTCSVFHPTSRPKKNSKSINEEIYIFLNKTLERTPRIHRKSTKCLSETQETEIS